MIRRLWNRFMRRKPALIPDTQPVPSSDTLPDDENFALDIPEHHAHAIDILGEVAQHLAEGDVAAFLLTVQHTDGKVYKMVFAGKQDADMERISVATMGQGKDMLKYMASLQGNAPLANRSDAEQ